MKNMQLSIRSSYHTNDINGTNPSGDQHACPGDHGIGVLTYNICEGETVTGVSRDHLIAFHLDGSGKCVCRIADEQHSQVNGFGSMTICQAGADWHVSSVSNTRVMALVVSAECMAWASAVAGHAFELRSQMGARDDELLSLAEACSIEASNGFPNGNLYWNELTDNVIEQTIQRHTARSPVLTTGCLNDLQIGIIRDFVMDNIAMNLSVDQLAGTIGLSRFHFSRAFGTTTGLTPHRFVMRSRLRHALKLVTTTDKSLTDIAISSGFADQSHLCRWAAHTRGLRLSRLRS